MTHLRSIGLGLVMVMMGFVFMALAPEPVWSAKSQDSTSATETISQGLDNAAKDTYSTNLTVSVFVGNLIRTVLAATGIVFLVITVYAGILYMTAAGDPEKIKKSKAMIVSSVIGLIIIIGAYALTSYVVGALSEASTATTTTGG